VHTPSRHWALEPQGDGLHGSTAGGKAVDKIWLSVLSKHEEYNLTTKIEVYSQYELIIQGFTS